MLKDAVLVDLCALAADLGRDAIRRSSLHRDSSAHA